MEQGVEAKEEMTEQNIIKVIDMMGAKPRTVASGNVMCNCVLKHRHEKGDRKASMSIKINDNGVSLVYCFGCKFKGSIVGLAYEFEKVVGCVGLVSEVKSLEFGGVYKPVFKPYDSIRHLRYGSDIAHIWLARRGKLNELDITEYGDCLGVVPKYVIDVRKISIEAIKAWKIGFWKRGRHGVFFPILDSEKRFVGYSIRWVHVKEDENSYFHMPGLKRKKILYGEGMINKERSNKFIIVEGAFDALKVWMAGYNPLSTLGGDFSDNHASKIVNLCGGMQGFVMGDGDKAGRELNLCVHNKLVEHGIKINVVDIKDGVDPGDMEPIEIKNHIESL